MDGVSVKAVENHEREPCKENVREEVVHDVSAKDSKLKYKRGCDRGHMACVENFWEEAWKYRDVDVILFNLDPDNDDLLDKDETMELLEASLLEMEEEEEMEQRAKLTKCGSSEKVEV
ncbi:unnamed protein product [Cuscuta epithymum]|uniref:EF-hand domain-containing protein n=1 Tax=Cuscuta epithymum TaxID=186058 RepID=A0AAV0ELA7_9ASTE|nr:unnamed protein product [Cuscuta epithymum]CAH9118187.1 unnamed protein product [Cuscuta epithymum]CAH9122892.1 unnamed protein product [Cuscuta epithymum]